MNRGEWTLERPGMEQWHKEPRPETVTTRQECSEGPRRQTPAISEKTRPEDATTGKHGKSWHDFQENYETGDRQANCRISSRITTDQEMDTVEGSTPSKAEKETALA
jgi:hypothetical protein